MVASSTPLHSTALVLLVLLGNLFFSGFISGWSAMLLLLQEENQYSDRCSTLSIKSGRCSDQDAALSLIYGVAQFVTTLCSLPAGLVLDRIGPVHMSAAAGTLAVLGFAMLAVSDSATFDAFIEGYCLIGVAGIATLLTSFQAGFSAVFFGTINHLLTSTGDDDAAYTKAFGWILPVGFVAAPAFDLVVARTGLPGAMYATTLLCVLYNVLALVPSLPLQATTFTAFTAFRGFLYSTITAFVATVFGRASLGTLLGTLYSICAIVALLEVPAAVAANASKDGRWLSGVSLGLAVLLLPWVELYRRRSARDCISSALKDPLLL
ncbi:hypothetical protein ACHHYP_10290 [Achlya hypogyna]|uniref:Major Facilitator Superfamily (MFS) n=1 Tax=Achlya hypogyna TaxID=1202772 RepID=A0A1V9YLU5_ACHHY|nr:hypothetical protein ACHHYP_10290 [Achlya hypogyna]